MSPTIGHKPKRFRVICAHILTLRLDGVNAVAFRRLRGLASAFEEGPLAVRDFGRRLRRLLEAGAVFRESALLLLQPRHVLLVTLLQFPPRFKLGKDQFVLLAAVPQ